MNTDIRVTLGFPRHPKTLQLQRALGAEGPYRMLCLWLWVAENRPDGDLAGLEDHDLEEAIGWRGHSGRFLECARTCGFVDGVSGVSKVHDWTAHNAWASDSHNRTFLAKLAALSKKHGRDKALRLLRNQGYADAVRAHTGQRARRSAERSAPSPSPSPSREEHPLPPPGGTRDLLGQGPKAVKHDPLRRFPEFYAVYPRHEARARAERAWAALDPDDALVDKILAAVAWQTRDGCLQPRADADGRSFVPLPASWIRARRWDDERPRGNGHAAAPPADPEFERQAKIRLDCSEAWSEIRHAVKLSALGQQFEPRLDFRGKTALERVGGLEALRGLAGPQLADKGHEFGKAYWQVAQEPAPAPAPSAPATVTA